MDTEVKKLKTKIFKYHNGFKWVGQDPVEIMVKLEEWNIDWPKKLAEFQNAQDMKSFKEIGDWIKKTFDLPDVKIDPDTGEDLGGLSIMDSVNILIDFVLYMEDLKKNIDPIQISPLPMDGANPEPIKNS